MAKTSEKKPEKNLQEFHFPTVEIDGVWGKTVFAESKEEAEKMVSELINK
mgnify:CR=1 FL=1